MTTWTIRLATADDLPAVNRICALTADCGADRSPRMTRPELVGANWADPYVVRDPSSCFVLVPEGGGEAAGYVVGTLVTAAFEQWQVEVFNPLRLRELRLAVPVEDPASLTEADRADLARLRRRPEELSPVPSWLAEYSAHLHIDLLGPVRRQGWGSRLMTAFFDHARAQGASGVHLGTSAGNRRAVAFYEAMGMTRLEEDDGGVTMVRDLR